MLVVVMVAAACACAWSREVAPASARARAALERCCARAGTCDATDCRLYRQFIDSYRSGALEEQCRAPLLYALWPPHRARAARLPCLATEHFLARLDHDIQTSVSQAALDAKEVEFLCLVDPRAIAHAQYRDQVVVLANGTRARRPAVTTSLHAVDARRLWRRLRTAEFSEIHVRAPRAGAGAGGARATCGDGRSLLALDAAVAVRRLLPELGAGGRRQRSPLRVLAHVYGVDARAHCVLCDYRDSSLRVNMRKFETSVSIYPHHGRVTAPERRAPPWARRDRLHARDSLWCAGYRVLLALHRPAVSARGGGGARYRPAGARRCHVLAAGGARVLKLLLGGAVQLAAARLPPLALHLALASAGARWKPESVWVVALGSQRASQRRRLRARWLPRHATHYAQALALHAPSGHRITIDTLGVEYFEDGTPDRFSQSIDGDFDHDADADADEDADADTDADWTEDERPPPEQLALLQEGVQPSVQEADQLTWQEWDQPARRAGDQTSSLSAEPAAQTTPPPTTNTSPTHATDLDKSATILDVDKTNIQKKMTQSDNSTSNSSKTTRIVVITVMLILLLAMLAMGSMWLMKSWGYKKNNQERMDAGTGSGQASAAALAGGAGAGGACGALDMVVQSLVVAQGVTIAVAARILWYLWHAHQAAAAAAAASSAGDAPGR